MAGSEITIICPACQATFTQAASSRVRRVQCPRCRQIVALESAAPRQGDPAMQARVELLEARIQTLELALAQMAAAALPSLARAPFRWSAPIEGAAFSPADAEVLRENLSKVPPYEIAIQAPQDNARAALLRTAFLEARWTVTERTRSALSIPANSLALATSLPVSPAMSAAYLALHASGFPLRPLFIPQGDEHLIVA